MQSFYAKSSLVVLRLHQGLNSTTELSWKQRERKCFFLSWEDRHTCVCVCCICTHECVCVSARSCVFLLQDNCIENLSEWMHSVNPNSATSIFTLCLSLPQSLTLEKKWNEHSRTVCGTQSLSQPYPGESAFPLDCCIALWCIYCDDNSSNSQDTGHTLHTLHTEPRSADLTHVISFHPGCYHLNPTGKWRDREADSDSIKGFQTLSFVFSFPILNEACCVKPSRTSLAKVTHLVEFPDASPHSKDFPECSMENTNSTLDIISCF